MKDSNRSKQYDPSLTVGELKTLPIATIQLEAEFPSQKKRSLYFSCRSEQGLFTKKLAKWYPESLWEERELQQYVPIQVTTEDDMEWWWFQDSFYQTRFVEGCPSQCLLGQLADFQLDSLGRITVKYSLNTAREVEAHHWVDGEVDWEPKMGLTGSPFKEQIVGYSPSEVAQAIFELRGVVETKAQKSRRLETINALLHEHDTLDERSMTQREEAERRLQGSHASRKRQPIPKKVKMYVWQRDGGRCVECGSKERLEYDHTIPLSKGGSNTDRNIQLLCERCNRSKGTSIS